ncbi:MAG: tetratricopeptide repeat protein [Candidatus Marinamargulisbacteria bacterium]
MNFKLSIFSLLLICSICMGFPELTPEDISIQNELTKKINLAPKNADLRFELAMEYAATGWIELGWDQLKLVPELQENYETIALKVNSEKIKQDPSNWKAHFRLAFAHYFMKDKDAAIESFKNVLKIKPDHEWSMGLIALILGEQKKYKDCIYWSKKGLKINNDATALHFLLGKAYYETGNYFGVMGETIQVGRLKSIEAKYRPTPPKGIE